MRPRFRVALAAVTSLSLLLAACGDDPTAPTADPAPVEDDVAEETLPADDPADDEAAAEPPADGDEPAADEPAGDPEPADEPESAPAEAPAGDCSAQGADLAVAPASDLPDEVAALRELLIDAALRCDEQLLSTAIDESSQFTYSFGEQGDALGHWWELEAAGEEPFLRLAQVLATTPALADGDDIYVWPRVHTGRPEDTTDEAWAEVTWMENPQQQAEDAGGYLGWRVGISTDGEWRFFVAGD